MPESYPNFSDVVFIDVVFIDVVFIDVVFIDVVFCGKYRSISSMYY